MIVRQFVNSIFESNSYLLTTEGSADAWVIDPGDADPLLKALDQDGKTLSGILLTHCHHDHIYGSNALQGRFPNALIHASAAAVAGLFSAKLNMSHYYLEPYEVVRQEVVRHGEGDVIRIGSGHVKVLETPGHHPSSLAFVAGDDLFTGDALVPGSKVITMLPGGNKPLARATIARLFNEFGPSTRVRPGHGDTVALGTVNRAICEGTTASAPSKA